MIRFFQKGESGNKKAKRRQLRIAMGMPTKPGRHERVGSKNISNIVHYSAALRSIRKIRGSSQLSALQY